MDDNTNKFFYISAIVAFSSYFVLVALLIVYISTNDVKKFDLFSKDTILELDIVVQKIKKTQKDKQPKNTS